MTYIRTIRLTAPSAEPVTVNDAKAHLLIDHAADDNLLAALISAARDKAERYCNRFFADATAAVLFDSLPSTPAGPLFVPLPDVASVDAVAYIDADNASQPIAGTTYDAEFQYLWPSATWPTVDVQGVRVEVSLVAPDGLDAVRQAILLYVADLYEHRCTLTTMQVYENRAAIALLQPYRVEIGI